MSAPIRPYNIDGPNTAEEPETLWNRFTRQRLKAWQPILAPRRVISCYIASGVVFFSFGIVLLLGSQSVEEYVVDYTDIATNRHGVGTFDIQVERDMEPPIWVYYQLDGFHQNHRRYVKSRSNPQMQEGGNTPPKILEQEIPECMPWITTSERVNYPCGVVARSVFNDTYVLRMRSSEADPWGQMPIDSRASTIAWSADLKSGKFSNLNPEARVLRDLPNQAVLNMWILQSFPPVVCEQVHISEQKPFVPVYVGMRNVTLPADPAHDKPDRQVSATDCSDYFGKPRCNFVRDGRPFQCTGDYREVRMEDWGIESGHFIVWMRVAGLPQFMKLWGRIDTPLKAGSTINVQFVSNFPVLPHHGRKAFVLSTASVLGGRNDFLGLGYLAVGGCSLLFGLVFLWRHIVKPRSLGDLSLLCEARPQEHIAM